MKNLILFVLFLFIYDMAHAQDFKPEEKEFGVGLKASGIWPLIKDPIDGVIDPMNLRLMYTYTEKITLRADLGFYGGTNKDFEQSGNSSSTTEESQSGFIFAPGAEYHFGGTEKLDPYIGAYLGLDFQGGSEKNTIFQSGNNTSTSIRTEPGTTKINFMLMTGFRYFVLERFALGLEAGFGYQRSSQSGQIIVTSGNNSSSSTIEKTDGGFRSGGLALHLSYFFGGSI